MPVLVSPVFMGAHVPPPFVDFSTPPSVAAYRVVGVEGSIAMESTSPPEGPISDHSSTAAEAEDPSVAPSAQTNAAIRIESMGHLLRAAPEPARTPGRWRELPAPNAIEAGERQSARSGSRCARTLL